MPPLLVLLGLLFSVNVMAADVTIGLTNTVSTTKKDTNTGEKYAGSTGLTVTEHYGSSTTVYTTGDKGMNNGSATAYYSMKCYKNGTAYTAFQTNQYAGYEVKIEDGKTFSVSSINSTIYASANITYKIAIEDENGNSLYSTASTTINNYKSSTSGITLSESGITDEAVQNLKGKFYVKAYFYLNNTGKYLCFPKLQITGTLAEAGEQTQWEKPTFTTGEYNGKTYSVTIASEEGSTIKYSYSGTEGVSTTNSVTIDVAPKTEITAVVTGEGLDDSNETTYTVKDAPTVATPTITLGSYNYTEQGYPVTVTCPEPDVTLTYYANDTEGGECENGKPLYLKDVKLYVKATKEGYTSSTTAAMQLNIAPDDDNSRPFQTTADQDDKDKDHKYISYTIPGTYIGGIGTDKNGIKFRTQRASLTKVNGNAIANAVEIKVNDGYIIDELNIKDFRANRDGNVTIIKVYVDGVEKTFADMGRTDESIVMNSSSGSYTTAKAFKNLNAEESIIIELENGTYDKSSTVDQFLATLQTVYHRAPVTVTLGQNGYSTFATDYKYTFTGAKAYKATYNEASSNVTLTEVEGVMPANAAVIFKGTEGEEVTITESKDDAVELTYNDLVGVTASTVRFLAGDNYVLASNGTQTAFVKMAEGKRVADMIGKAYLSLHSTAAAKAVLFFGDNATGINAVSNDNAATDNTLYNIAGQRVTKNAKGIIIVNGKAYIRVVL